MARALYLPEARQDLLEIWGYVFEGSQSESIADGVIDAIDAAVQSLAAHPEIGELRPELSPFVRCLSVKKTYAVFYVACGDDVEIVQVIHGARDIPIHFRKQPSSR